MKSLEARLEAETTIRLESARKYERVPGLAYLNRLSIASSQVSSLFSIVSLSFAELALHPAVERASEQDFKPAGQPVGQPDRR